MPKDFLVQFSPPTKYLEAEYGQICAVTKDDESVEYYIQTAQEGDSKWIYIGLFLQVVFENKFHDAQFMQDCLKLYGERK